MKIAHLIDHLSPSLETRIHDVEAILNLLSSSGVSSQLLLPPPQGGKRVFPLPGFGLPVPLQTWRRILSSDEFALAHFHGATSYAASMGIFCLLTGLPSIVSLERNFDGKKIMAALGNCRVRPSRILCSTKIDAARAQERLPDLSVDYLPSPVDITRFPRGDGLGYRHRSGIAQQNPMILILGPNPLEVLGGGMEKILNLHQRNLIGLLPLGQDSEKLRQEIGREFGREHRLRVLCDETPSDSVLRDAIAAADMVFVLPDCPQADQRIIDTWCTAHPLITMDRGESGLLVRNGIDGTVCDSDTAVVRAIAEIFSDPSRGATHARNGMARILSEFETSKVIRRLCAIYANTIEEYEEGPGRWHWRQLLAG